MSLIIPEHEIEITAVRAQGAGGQNVNKVSNAVHLRFDVRAFRKPDHALSITVSIGVAERDEYLNSPQKVIRAADQALYRAKELGRNRVSQ